MRLWCISGLLLVSSLPGNLAFTFSAGEMSKPEQADGEDLPKCGRPIRKQGRREAAVAGGGCSEPQREGARFYYANAIHSC